METMSMDAFTPYGNTAQAGRSKADVAAAGLYAAKGEEMRAKAVEFETMFVAAMLAPMFETLPTDGPFGGGNAEDSMRSFHTDAMAREITRKGGLGIADAVQRQLIAMQSV